MYFEVQTFMSFCREQKYCPLVNSSLSQNNLANNHLLCIGATVFASAVIPTPKVVLGCFFLLADHENPLFLYECSIHLNLIWKVVDHFCKSSAAAFVKIFSLNYESSLLLIVADFCTCSFSQYFLSTVI